MLLSNETCNIFIVITALILGVLAFTKDIAEKYPTFQPINRLGFRVVVVILCTFFGWKLTVMKDSNSDKDKAAMRKTDETNRLNFQNSLFNRHKADSIALKQQRTKIDSLRDIVQIKDDQIISAQARTIMEIQGADLPWVEANTVPQPGAWVINFSVTNLRRIPTNAVMISFVDALDYYNTNFPAKPKGGVDNQDHPIEQTPEWMFMKYQFYPALTPGKQYFFYQKSFKGYPWPKVDYDVDVSWRGGSYTYRVVVNKVKNDFQIANEIFLYNGKSYNRHQFTAKFFSGKNKPYYVQPNVF